MLVNFSLLTSGIFIHFLSRVLFEVYVKITWETNFLDMALTDTQLDIDLNN